MDSPKNNVITNTLYFIYTNGINKNCIKKLNFISFF